MRLFITINSMPVSERVKSKCRKAERTIILPYAGITFAFWQAAKFYELDRLLGFFGLLLIMHVASIHMAGEKNRPTVALAALVSLSITALSTYFSSDVALFLAGIVGLFIIIFLASNLRRREIVRTSSPGLRNWPD